MTQINKNQIPPAHAARIFSRGSLHEFHGGHGVNPGCLDQFGDLHVFVGLMSKARIAGAEEEQGDFKNGKESDCVGEVIGPLECHPLPGQLADNG